MMYRCMMLGLFRLVNTVIPSNLTGMICERVNEQHGAPRGIQTILDFGTAVLVSHKSHNKSLGSLTTSVQS